MDSLYCELLIFLKFTGQNKWQSQRDWVVPFWVSTVIFAVPNFRLPACLPYNPSLPINLHLHFNHAHGYLRPHIHWRCIATDLNNRLLVANICLLLSFGRLVMVHSKGSGTFKYLSCHGVLQLLFGMHNRSRQSSIWLGKHSLVTCVCARECPFWSNMAFVLLYSIQEPPATISQPSEEAKRMGVTAPRFCKSWNVFKPPRSHHCSSCGRCVLKMDHHCPWINNCVGYDNYGHFLRFVLYVDLATLYVLILLIWRVRTIMDDIRHFRVREDGIVILDVTRAISNWRNTTSRFSSMQSLQPPR